MTPRRLPLALALLVLPALAAAQSKSDAFAGKIPPVSGQLYRTAGRLELTLGGAFSLNDAFFSKYMGGLKVGYHFSDSFYAGLVGTAGTTSQVVPFAICVVVFSQVRPPVSQEVMPVTHGFELSAQERPG